MPKALETLAHDDRTSAVNARQAANRLAQVNSKNRDLHRNLPSSPTDTRNYSCGWVGRQFIPLAHTRLQDPKARRRAAKPATAEKCSGSATNSAAC
jgi:hypothetical protein